MPGHLKVGLLSGDDFQKEHAVVYTHTTSKISPKRQFFILPGEIKRKHAQKKKTRNIWEKTYWPFSLKGGTQIRLQNNKAFSFKLYTHKRVPPLRLSKKYHFGIGLTFWRKLCIYEAKSKIAATPYFFAKQKNIKSVDTFWNYFTTVLSSSSFIFFFSSKFCSYLLFRPYLDTTPNAPQKMSNSCFDEALMALGKLWSLKLLCTTTFTICQGLHMSFTNTTVGIVFPTNSQPAFKTRVVNPKTGTICST